MARLLGHRQTKGAATDKPILPPPRHIPTLPMAATCQGHRVETKAAPVPRPTASTVRFIRGDFNRSARRCTIPRQRLGYPWGVRAARAWKPMITRDVTP
jgi:hypothetical protein